MMTYDRLVAWLGFKGTPKAVRKPDGYSKTTGPHGEIVDCDTLQCRHCGSHWEVVVGSGRLRGWCSRCLGYCCGRPECFVCIPIEQRLQNIEAGRPMLTPSPSQIALPRGRGGLN